MKIKYSATTSIGSRQTNMDVYYATVVSASGEIKRQHIDGEIENNDCTILFALCDGIGSFPRSGEAAENALNVIKYYSENSDEEKTSLEDYAQKLLFAARSANANFCKEEQIEASTTLSLFLYKNGEYYFLNIGDSPAYLLSGKKQLTEISTRHNLAMIKRMDGQLPEEDDKRTLVHHLYEGEDTCVTYSDNKGVIKPGSKLLICSDGVADAFKNKKIKKCLRKNKDSDYFVSVAEKQKYADNCTAIVVSFG